MTKQEALRLVSDHMASWMSASTLSECTGVEEAVLETMSEADVERLEWAAEQVCERLNRMGGS